MIRWKTSRWAAFGRAAWLQLALFALFTGAAAAQVPFRHVILDPAGSAPAKPYGKAIGDLSGDGRPDAFAASADGGGMHWYEFPGWTKRTIRSAGSWSEDVQLADVDGDGDQDVIAGNSSGVYYYQNPLPAGDPHGGDWKASKIGSDGVNVHDLEVGDLNDVRRLDVAVRYTILPSVERMHGLGLADFNSDGRLDIHTSLRHDLPGADDRVSIWLSGGEETPLFTEQVLATSGSHFSKVGDVGGDGDHDIVGANWSSQAPNGAPIELWENRTAANSP